VEELSEIRSPWPEKKRKEKKKDPEIFLLVICTTEREEARPLDYDLTPRS